jgi:hypothetical protein
LSRRALLVAAAVALVMAVLVAVSGGTRFAVAGFRISARSPLPAAFVAFGLMAAWAWIAARSGMRHADLIDASSRLDRSAWAIVIVIAAISTGVAVGSGTFSAAGADASGYLSQAHLWASREWRLADPLSLLPGWPADPGITAPLGWNAASERGWQVPTYGPGLPLLMAIPFAAGGPLVACLIVAFAAGVAIVATGSLACRLGGSTAAIVGAATLATCPSFVYQSVQPMSDVPVTAAWIACWALLIKSPASARTFADELRRGHASAPFGRIGVTRYVFAGSACAIAVLIRPNLAPLAIVPLLFVWWTTPDRERQSTGLSFATPVVVAGLFLAWLQWRWYGSPFQSGYGSPQQLYSLTNVVPNVSAYGSWLISTSPILLLATGAVVARRDAVTWALVAFSVLNVAAYLAYFVFHEWSYLRFLLPSLAIAAALVGVLVDVLVGRLPASARAAAVFAVVIAIVFVGLSQTRDLDAFRLTDTHRRVLQIDRYLEAALPSRAVVIAGEQSGALRFDAGHPIVRWEAASPEDLTRALAALERDQRPVWILLDAWEEPLVRAKFSGLPLAALDWPPAVDAGETQRTRAWSVADRERYLTGGRVVTDRLR